MNMNMMQTVAREFSVAPWQVEHFVALLDEGNTLPFIARYRKEQHGSLYDQVLRKMSERITYLRTLDKRREDILSTLRELGVLHDELEQAILRAATQSELEDLYRPYKPKRRTRAGVAREKGLESLAELLLAQDLRTGTLEALAAPYVDAEKGVGDVSEALAGARDIIAERVSDDPELRRALRRLTETKGRLISLAATRDDSVYRLYYDYNQPLRQLVSHRVLAVNRGEAEGFLKVHIQLPEAEALTLADNLYVRPGSLTSGEVRTAVHDAYERLLFPSLERETRQALTDKASEAAIQVFSTNLRHLLMQQPVKGKTVLALDPGIRTGCKVAVVDETSRVLDTGVLYPLPQHGRVKESQDRLRALITRHGVTVLAIGNGTASRETEQFVADTITALPDRPGYTVVNEAGASVYSASELAAEELPDLDVSVRSAVSLARRLQDPLAELVKIDPKAIGVGQYQHDMKEKSLDESLCGVVEDCVNAVGVDVNTASPALLARVAGIGPQLAKGIVAHRQENGPFTSRTQLKKIKKLGPKAFEQCAGFLRIPGGKNPLDASAVHPESYEAAKALLSRLGYQSFAPAKLEGLRDKVTAYPASSLCQELGVGAPTLRDMVEELLKPGRDPREDLPPVTLRTDVLTMDDLVPGMELTGTVRNVVDFGAFVDIGVHRDGLVHISRMSRQHIAHPSQVLKVGDAVKTYVVEVSKEKNQIALSLLKP